MSGGKGGKAMTDKRKIEVFSAGCAVCNDTVKLVNSIACPSCDVTVLDMNVPDVAERAKTLGIRSVPAVVIDGKLADCCTGRGPDEATLKAAGVGQPLA
jgi:glutaredoxin